MFYYLKYAFTGTILLTWIKLYIYSLLDGMNSATRELTYL